MTLEQVQSIHSRILRLLQQTEIALKEGNFESIDELVRAVEQFQSLATTLASTNPSLELKQRTYDVLHDLQVLLNNMSATIQEQKASIARLKQQQKINTAYHKGM